MSNSKRIRSVLLPLFLLCVMVYLGYHFVSGNNGILAWSKLHHERNILAQQSELVEEQHQEMERRVNMLYSDSVDKDLLDEQARYMLGVVGKDEIIYFDEKK